MLRPAALAALLALAACDSASVESQRLFEEQALLSPITDITRVDGDGTVVSRDPADWRIGPAYTGVVGVLDSPYPNPTPRTGQLTLVLDVTGGVRGGLQATVLYVDPETGRQELVDVLNGDCPAATASTICTFVLSARQVDYRNAGGLYRLVVLDGAGIVTYGDVEVVT